MTFNQTCIPETKQNNARKATQEFDTELEVPDLVSRRRVAGKEHGIQWQLPIAAASKGGGDFTSKFRIES